jgi:ferritin-like metal-binding protein YciE
MATKMESFKDLFIHELKDLYSAESQLIEAIPMMAEAASTKKLKEAFRSHLDETKKQRQRLEKIGEMMGVDMKGETCEGMKGLIKEGESIIKAKAEGDIKDAALITAAQKVEHYEIAGYGTAVHYADLLQESEISDILAETLDEEKSTDSKLNRLAKQSVNIKAESMHH